MLGRRALIAIATGAAAALAAAGVAGAGTGDRPMSGSCDTTFSIPNTGVISITGTCLLTHLGLARYTATQTALPNADGTLHLTITGFYTAANGDILRSTLDGTGRFTATGVAYSTTETFTGGTGRFANASGSDADEGVAAFTGATTGTSSFVTSGQIAY
jgi:hypothetical protein